MFGGYCQRGETKRVRSFRTTEKRDAVPRCELQIFVVTLSLNCGFLTCNFYVISNSYDNNNRNIHRLLLLILLITFNKQNTAEKEVFPLRLDGKA